MESYTEFKKNLCPVLEKSTHTLNALFLVYKYLYLELICAYLGDILLRGPGASSE
jgi:hypothetical protein